VTFHTIATEWLTHLVPLYKPSTQQNRWHLLQKHSMPRFGDRPTCDVSRQAIQKYVSVLRQTNYAPKTIGHISDVLRAILRTSGR
jgi:hypothetical protein